VWFFFDNITTIRAGSMLPWLTKPTRQPDFSPSASVVTMNIG